MSVGFAGPRGDHRGPFAWKCPGMSWPTSSWASRAASAIRSTSTPVSIAHALEHARPGPRWRGCRCAARGERRAAHPADARVELGHPGLHRRERVRHRGAARVVEVEVDRGRPAAASRNRSDERPRPRPGVAMPVVSPSETPAAPASAHRSATSTTRSAVDVALVRIAERRRDRDLDRQPASGRRGDHLGRRRRPIPRPTCRRCARCSRRYAARNACSDANPPASTRRLRAPPVRHQRRVRDSRRAVRRAPTPRPRRPSPGRPSADTNDTASIFGSRSPTARRSGGRGLGPGAAARPAGRPGARPRGW